MSTVYSKAGADALFAAKQPQPGVTTVAASGTSRTLTLPAAGDAAYDITLTGNCTFSLTGGTAGKFQTLTVILRQDATAARTATFPSAVAWPGQAPPALNLGASKYDVVQFSTTDGGTTWTGTLAASAVQPVTVPQSPVSVVVTPASTQNVLSWSPAGSGGSSITGYGVYRGTSAGSETLLTTLGLVTSYTDSSLTDGTAYFYKIAAVNAVGSSSQSSEVRGQPGHYVNLPAGGRASTPYSATYAPGSSAVDIRVLASMASWVPSGNAFILDLWGTNPMYGLYIDVNGKLNAPFYNAAGVFQGSPSTVALGFLPNATKWVRGLIDPTAGTTTYYTSDDGTTWTQLGTTITGLTTTGIRTDATSPSLSLGQTGAGAGQWTGRVYQAKLLIGASQVAGFDATAKPAGTGTFTGTAGEVWTPATGAAVV